MKNLYTVKPGESPADVAQKYTGRRDRYRDLLVLNKHLRQTTDGMTGRAVFDKRDWIPGMGITIPKYWADKGPIHSVSSLGSPYSGFVVKKPLPPPSPLGIKDEKPLPPPNPYPPGTKGMYIPSDCANGDQRACDWLQYCMDVGAADSDCAFYCDLAPELPACNLPEPVSPPPKEEPIEPPPGELPPPVEPPPGELPPPVEPPPGEVEHKGTSNAFKYAAVGVGVALLGGMILMISDKK